MQISVFWTGGTTTDFISTSFELTAKEKLYRDTLAKALAEQNKSFPASKRRKNFTEHSSKNVNVDEGIKNIFILLRFSYSTRNFFMKNSANRATKPRAL